MNRRLIHILGFVLLLAGVGFTIFKKSPPAKSTVPEQVNRPTPIRKHITSSIPVKDSQIFLLKTDVIRIFENGSVLMASNEQEYQIALREARALPPSSRRDDAIALILGNFARKFPEKAKEEWLKWKNARTEPWLEAASNICRHLALKDPYAPSDFINAHVPESSHHEIWRPLFHTMDPQAVSEALSTLPVQRGTLYSASNLVPRWLATNPQDSIRWLDQVFTILTESQRTMFFNILPYSPQRSYAEINPELAVSAYRDAENIHTRKYLAKLIPKLPDLSDEQRDFITAEFPIQAENPLIQKIRDDPFAVANTLNATAFASLSRHEQSFLTDTLRDKNPGAAVAWLKKIGQHNRLRNQLISWHRLEPEAAANFALGLEFSKEQQRIITSMAEFTAHFKDRDSTMRLIKALKSDDQRKTILSILNRK